MAIYKGLVTSVYDETDGERIRVRLYPIDNDVSDENLPYAFPFLPKQFRVKPKVGEGVFVLLDVDNKMSSQRYYVGPIITQPQDLPYESFADSGKLMYGAEASPKQAPSTTPTNNGCYAENDDDIVIYSRGDTDIILSDNEIRLRCKSRSGDTYNKKNPSYLKLKYYDKELNNGSLSTASLVSQDINLLSTDGDGVNEALYNVASNNGEITDSDMNKILEKAHALPYGDTLVEFLQLFLQMFKSHTHKYANMPPCPDDNSKALDRKFGTGGGTYTQDDYVTTSSVQAKWYENVSKTFGGLGQKLLSKHIRIN